jgi:aminopeptidase N
VDSVSPLMRLLNANSYEKGAWVLHMLRRELGDSLFKVVIRTYYDRYKGKNAETDDFRKVAEDVSLKKMGLFFRQWLYAPDIPQLNIQQEFNEKRNELSVTITQLQNELFQFPIEFEIESETQKAKIVKVQVSKRTETFNFRVEKKLLRFVVDPNISLLFEQVKK